MKAKTALTEVEVTKDDYEALQKVSEIGIFQLISDEFSYFRQTNLMRLSDKFEKKCKKYKKNPKKVAPKFLQRFIDSASYEEDESLQDIWVDLLLKESEEPDSNSLRTIDTLKNLSHEEAEIFLGICKNAIWICGSIIICNDRSTNASIDDIIKLVDSGLIVSDNIYMTVSLKIKPGEKKAVSFSFDKSLVLFVENINDAECSFVVPVFSLTRAGQDIFKASIMSNLSQNNYTRLAKYIKEKNPRLKLSLNKIVDINQDGSKFSCDDVDLFLEENDTDE